MNKTKINLSDLTEFICNRDIKKLNNWTVADISQATSGEMGELQNKLKKKYTQKEKITKQEIEEEFADVIKYLLLLASKCKVDISKAIIDKLNYNPVDSK